MRVVTENRPVRVDFEEAAAAAGLRKASEREGTLRIVDHRRIWTGAPAAAPTSGPPARSG